MSEQPAPTSAVARVARWLLGRFDRQALVLVAAAMTPLTLPVMGLVSALVTLRAGVARAALGWSLAAVTLLALGWSLGSGAALFTLFVGVTLPIMLMAQVLGTTRSWQLALSVGFAMASVLLLVFLSAVEDPTAWWRSAMAQAVATLEAQQGEPLPPEVMARIETAQLGAVAGNLIGLWIAVSIGLLLLARAWQAAAFNPGGFAAELVNLRAGRLLAAIGIAIVVLGATLQSIGWLNWIAIVFSFWTVMGLIGLHGWLRNARFGALWLATAYGFLFVGLIGANPLIIAFPIYGLAREFYTFARPSTGSASDGD